MLQPFTPSPTLPVIAQFLACPRVYDSHLTIVPGDRDRIPTRLSDCHCCGSHCLLTLTQFQCSSC
jgi:hypothetical protein